jgi:rsbT co-antagonist protein RsbR
VSTAPTHQGSTDLGTIISRDEDEILTEWMREMADATKRGDLIKNGELREQCTQLLGMIRSATGGEEQSFSVHSAKWQAVRELLDEISRTRAVQGFTPSETARFVFSLKKPLFHRVAENCKNNPDALARLTWTLSEMLDSLGLYTTEVYQKSREEMIKRQQEDLLELSTPVVKLWDGILALPLIGTLDSARTQVVMESLLEAIVQTNSRVAIIDITGVPTVDTVVAQHLLKTVTAARLMGADCIISGVRPQIAQTIVHLGINLLDITTKATLSAAFGVALQRVGYSFVRDGAKA